jgi:hypothetical protein
VAAAAALLALFLRWYRVESASVPVAFDADPQASGWALLEVTDVVVAAAAAGAVALALALVSGARLGLRALGVAGALFALALGLVVRRALDPPVHAVVGHADVVAALGPYLAMAALASMALAVGLCAVWRT